MICTIDIKAFYTVKEIQKFLGYKYPESTLRFLKKIPVPLHLVGKKFIVYLTDIKNSSPELYSSILECNHLSNLSHLIKDDNDNTLIKEFFND